MVTDVDPDSEAADKRHPGRRRHHLGQFDTTVNGADDVDKAMAEAVKAGRKAVLVQVTRDDGNRFVALPVAKG